MTAFGARAGSASVRNRAKRQAREAFQAHQHRLPNKMTIVIAAKGKIASLTRREIRKEIEELLIRASRRRPPLSRSGTPER